ncbi:MAG TPA: MarR family transcriptional regulator [Thermoanaerobaculia bacterium]|nr:MarR family transcriptional regulator [Thermoanaerobaculia bacterium]
MPVNDERSPLQKELQQQRPFRSRGQEAVIALLRTADLLRRHLSRVVEPHGITLQQYNVLRILRGAGEGGLPTLTIGERMIEQTPGVTRLLDRLEAKGLVTRCRGESDRRQVFCRLTSEGLLLLARIEPEMNVSDEAGVAMLDAEAKTRLLELLTAIRAGHG